MRKAALAALFLSFACAVATMPAFAQTLYNNFTSYSDTAVPYAAYGIFGAPYYTTDSFTLGSSATVAGVTFDYWVYASYPTDESPLNSIEWSIGTSPYGAQDGTGTAVPTSYTYLNTRNDGAGNFQIYTVTLPVTPEASLGSGTTYWLTFNNASSPGPGGYAYWDTSDGPSTAYSPEYGQIPSESFTLFGNSGPTAVPEYSPFDLPAVIGVLAIALLFHKRIVNRGIRSTT